MNSQKIIRYIPPYNLFFRWFDSDLEKMSRIKKIWHTAYGTIGGLGLAAAILYGSLIGYKEYIKWSNKETIARVNELKTELFGENGLADKNDNGKLDLTEVAEVYERMGLGEKVLETGKFPSLSIEDLERAVEIYRSQE